MIRIVNPFGLRPNTGLQRTPLRVDRDRCDFDTRIQLECFPDLLGRRR